MTPDPTPAGPAVPTPDLTPGRGWRAGDTAFGLELPGGMWVYLAVPFAIDGTDAKPYRVVHA